MEFMAAILLKFWLANYKHTEYYDEHVRDWERFQRDPGAFDVEGFIRF